MATIDTLKLAARIADAAYRTDFVLRDQAVQKSGRLVRENIAETGRSCLALGDEIRRAWMQAPGGRASGVPAGAF